MTSGRRGGAEAAAQAGRKARLSQGAFGLLWLFSLFAAGLVIAAAARPGGAAERAVSLLEDKGAVALVSSEVREGLVRSPLDAELIRAVALAFGEEDSARATRLMTIAGGLSWRDTSTQTWLFDHYFHQGNYDLAAEQADALLRRRPEMAEALHPSERERAARPGGARALVARLRAKPSWRAAFLATLGANAEPETTLALLRKLARTAEPPTTEEVTAYASRLMVLGRFREARLTLPEFEGGRGAPWLLRNGTFEDNSGALPFAWNYFQGAGGGASVETSPDARSGKSLYVVYDSYSDAMFAEQYLALLPGRYHFAGESISQSGSGRQPRLQWTVTCLPARVELMSAPTLASDSWRGFKVGFEVPAEGCEGQILALRPLRGDHRMNLTVWYDNLAIDEDKR